MLTHKLKLLLLALIACTMFSACAFQPATKEDVDSTQQALTPVTIDMWAPYELAPPVAGTRLFTINEDPAHPTPNFIQLQVSQTVAIPDQYSVSFRTAHGLISAADWNTMSLYLHNGTVTGIRTKVRVTYDSSVVGDQKPWVTPLGIQFFSCVGIGLMWGPNCG